VNKIWLILKSEFWRRVRSKSFIVATLLAPVGIIALLVLPAVFGYFGSQSGDRTIAVRDETQSLKERLESRSESGIQFVFSEMSEDSLRAAVRAETYDGYLLLPDSLIAGKGQAAYYSTEGGGLSTQNRLESMVSRAVQQERLTAQGATDAVMSIVGSDVDLTARKLTEEGTAADNSLIYLALGYVMAFAIYFAVFIYGQFVMQGVIEEKANRVVEIVVSSVRPFELLMGKVLGIGAMGLTQMFIWSAVAFGGLSVSGTVMALFVDPADLGVGSGASQAEMAEAAGFAVPDLSPMLLVWFLLFYLGGYLLYASIFAAVGSTVEQQQDAQNLLFIVMIPLLIPILLLSFMIEAPNAMLATVLSMIPFFSPILMPLRLALASVPVWQTLLAVVLLALTFIAMIWVAGRIYRVGIFMYGKPPSVSEVLRWAGRG
jgi:ABC-2 type transport system permease protein